MGQTVELMAWITVNPDQCGGRPCVRGMRIRAIDVLDLLAAGLSHDQVLEELPDLEADDLGACLRFASGSQAAASIIPFSPRSARMRAWPLIGAPPRRCTGSISVRLLACAHVSG